MKRLLLLIALGVAEGVLFFLIGRLDNLVRATVPFLLGWGVAVALYTLAVLLVLRWPPPQRAGLAVVFLGAVFFRALLLPAFPTSSDDMFRYIWDGRVQAHGINPYYYPPAAPELVALRDEAVWPFINRKQVPTIYPPAAQLAFLALWRVVPDSVVGTKAAFALVDVAVGAVLARALVWAGRSPLLALIYLWHPLPVIEFAHAGHLDPLAILPLVAALAARLRERPALSGVLLGLATLVKFYPAVLLGAWWRWREWRLLLAFGATVLLLYLPYLGVGAAVIGFLPGYFGEEEYTTGGRYFFYRPLAGVLPPAAFVVLVVGVLAVLIAWCLRRPLPVGSPAFATRGLTLVLVALLLVTPSFPWYYAWLLPLAAFQPRPAPLYLAGAVVLAYPWWWLPELTSVPGPQLWIVGPTLALALASWWRAGVFARLWPLAARARLRDPA
ncbi:MAG: glycosyltransferase 87 family protein [Chloroflexi bacterium]|nr:glycosyltransferase 87 family protein [Chloroflexota bacterium]